MSEQQHPFANLAPQAFDLVQQYQLYRWLPWDWRHD